MPRLARRIGLLVIATTPYGALAQANQEPPKRIAASSFATVEVHLNARPIGRRWYEEDASLTGPARIAISYGQPHARGRKIVGGLIPKDTVWRFGANEATVLHTDLDLTLGGFDLPRGDYSLFLLNSGTTWQLIVNSRTGIWGTDRNPAQDLGRVPLTATTKTDNEETLTIYLIPDSTDPTTGYAALSGKLRIRWGTTELTTNWSVKQ